MRISVAKGFVRRVRVRNRNRRKILCTSRVKLYLREGVNIKKYITIIMKTRRDRFRRFDVELQGAAVAVRIVRLVRDQKRETQTDKRFAVRGHVHL